MRKEKKVIVGDNGKSGTQFLLPIFHTQDFTLYLIRTIIANPNIKVNFYEGLKYEHFHSTLKRFMII